MLPRQNFETLHTVMAILVLFEYFFNPNSECFAKYDAFYSHISDYACFRRKIYRYRRGLKLWKNCIHQNIFENGVCILLILPPWP